MLILWAVSTGCVGADSVGCSHCFPGHVGADSLCCSTGHVGADSVCCSPQPLPDALHPSAEELLHCQQRRCGHPAAPITDLQQPPSRQQQHHQHDERISDISHQ